MKTLSEKCAFLSCLLVPALLAGCGTKSTEQSVAIANPASEHCVKKGGKLEIVKDASGQKGMCHLPDGTVVDEWELFRRDNPRG